MAPYDNYLKGAVDKLVGEAVTAELSRRGLSPEQAQDTLTATGKEHDKERLIRAVMTHNGYFDSEAVHKFASPEEAWEGRMTWKALVDTLSTTNFTHLIPRVVSEVVREAVEPQLVLTRLLRQIRFSAGTTVNFPAVSGMSGVKDMGETDNYPELVAPRFAGMMTVTIGKVGCAIRITEDMVKYSQWDIMGMAFRGAGRAMARFKEGKVANLMSDNAVVSFDNSGATSTHGSTTGRDIDAAFNNTLRLDDLFRVYADMVNDGFIPNTLCMNAMGWLISARDPSMRAVVFQHGQTPIMHPHQGDPGLNPHWQPNLGPQAGSTNLNYSSSTYVDVPHLFPVPLTILVSPFISYDSTASTTDLFMLDREEFGLLVVDEDVMTDQWDEPNRDIRMVKFREKYGMQLLNNGYAVRKLAGISLDRGYDFEDSKAVYDIATATLPS